MFQTVLALMNVNTHTCIDTRVHTYKICVCECMCVCVCVCVCSCVCAYVSFAYETVLGAFWRRNRKKGDPAGGPRRNYGEPPAGHSRSTY